MCPVSPAALAVATERAWVEERRELCASLGRSLTILRYLDDLLTVRETALAVARHAGDANAKAEALNGVGIAYSELRRSEEAIASYQQEAAAALRATGDHEQAAGLELLAANTPAQRRRWWQRPWRPPEAT
jgi:tetratricopeptide (TPR) repeat protein